VVSILVLDARNKSLIPEIVDVSLLQSAMVTEELYGDQWLLSYEANVKGWIRTHGTDYVSSEPCFSFLKRHDIHFYDDSLSDRIAYIPPEGWIPLY